MSKGERKENQQLLGALCVNGHRASQRCGHVPRELVRGARVRTFHLDKPSPLMLGTLHLHSLKFFILLQSGSFFPRVAAEGRSRGVVVQEDLLLSHHWLLLLPEPDCWVSRSK